MFTITNVGKKAIETQVKKALENTEKSTKEILADLYISGLPGKNLNQANLVADRVIEVVSDFDLNMQKAIENFDEWITDTIASVVEGKEIKEQYEILLNFYVTVITINADSVKKEFENSSFSVEETFLALKGPLRIGDNIEQSDIDELRGKLAEALKNNGLLYSSLGISTNYIQALMSSEEVAIEFSAEIFNDAKLKAIGSMIAYISAKNGSMPNLSPNVTIEEVTIGYCAEIEKQKASQNPNLTMGTLAAVFNMIGAVAISTFCGYCLFDTIAIGAGVLSALLLESPLIGVLAAATLGIVVATTMYDIAIDMTKKPSKTLAVWTYAGFKFVKKGTEISVEKLGEIYRKAEAYIKETVIPATVKTITDIFEFLNQIIEKGIVCLSGATQDTHVVTNLN